MMLFVTKNKLRKLVDDILDERAAEAEHHKKHAQMFGSSIKPAPKEAAFEIATLHPVDKATSHRPELLVRPVGEPPQILANLLRALRDLGIEIVQHDALPASWELRKAKEGKS